MAGSAKARAASPKASVLASATRRPRAQSAAPRARDDPDRRNVGGLRRRDTYLAIREATLVTVRREDFRIVHASIQRDHIHLIVEADSKSALSKGVQGFSISAARQINKAITARGGDRRTGKVISDRFHARPLTSPRAVRNTLSYVLNNWRHHHEDTIQPAQSWRVDPFSSGPLFFGWKELADSPIRWPLRSTYHPLLVRRPTTWLLAKGWSQFHPLISVREVPGPPEPQRRPTTPPPPRRR